LSGSEAWDLRAVRVAAWPSSDFGFELIQAR
jgi:hypothetical protein